MPLLFIAVYKTNRFCAPFPLLGSTADLKLTNILTNIFANRVVRIMLYHDENPALPVLVKRGLFSLDGVSKMGGDGNILLGGAGY